MDKNYFVPLTVVGSVFAIEIVSLEQALAYLEGWPTDGRTTKWRNAFHCCKCALDGLMTADTAHRAVCVFAASQGALGEPPSNPIGNSGDGDRPVQTRH